MRTFHDETELGTVEEIEYVKEHLALEEDLKREMEIFEEEEERWLYEAQPKFMKKDSCEMTCEDEEEEKEREKCRHSKRTPLEVNCKSEIHVKPKNKIIYVCPKTAAKKY